MFDIIVTLIFIVIPIVNCMSIACIKYQQNCSCGETVCVIMNNNTI